MARAYLFLVSLSQVEVRNPKGSTSRGDAITKMIKMKLILRGQKRRRGREEGRGERIKEARNADFPVLRVTLARSYLLRPRPQPGPCEKFGKSVCAAPCEKRCREFYIGEVVSETSECY